MFSNHVPIVIGSLLLGPPSVALPATPADGLHRCPVEAEGIVLRGGGMAGFGWDGIGENAVTIYWHVRRGTSDLGDGQRQAIIDALQAWANVVQISFEERAFADRDVAIDFDFVTGDHCSREPAECPDADCPFDGAGGVLAHAGFPPTVLSQCVAPMAETFAGNVHFDDAETWEQDGEGPAGAFSLTLVAVHEIGHALGLVHSGDTNDVMFASVGNAQTFTGLGSGDITNIRSGYAAGTGSVVTLETIGIWCDSGYLGPETGLPLQPFDTVAEGVQGVPFGSTDVEVHLETGNYNEALTITQAMLLQAENGPAIIGE